MLFRDPHMKPPTVEPFIRGTRAILTPIKGRFDVVMLRSIRDRKTFLKSHGSGYYTYMSNGLGIQVHHDIFTFKNRPFAPLVCLN